MQNISKLNIHVAKVVQRVVWIPFRIILRFFVRLEVSGLENLKNTKQRIIYAANHANELDAIFLGSSLPFKYWLKVSPLFPVAVHRKYIRNKNWWRNIFYGDFLFSMLGAYTILKGRKNYEDSLYKHKELLDNNYNICIFPEGARTLDGEIQKPRGGVAYLAKKTDAHIIPVPIYGTYKISIKDFLLRKRKVFVRFGQPISPDELFENKEEHVEDYHPYANIIMDKISKDLNFIKRDN